MSIEEKIISAIDSLFAGKVWPDVNPNAEKVLPYAVYQQSGGDVVAFSEGGLANTRNARMQITVWAKTRAEASQKMRAVAIALNDNADMQAEPTQEPSSRRDAETGFYGSMQFFNIWYDD